MLKSSIASAKVGPDIAASPNNLKKKNHPFYIASLFDVFAQVSQLASLLESEVTGTWGFRNSHMTIVTRDPDSQDAMEWVIRGSAYGGLEIVLEVDGVYFLKGRLLALNQPGEQKFYYEPKNQILAVSSKELKGDLANSVSVSGLGIIISRIVENVAPGRENVNVVVRHTDYNPEIRSLSTFDVEYRCLWSPLMEKLQPLLTINREVLLVGHIIGRDLSKHMWIVEVCSYDSENPLFFNSSNLYRIFDSTAAVQGSSQDLKLSDKEEDPSTPTPNKRGRASSPRKSQKVVGKRGKITKSEALTSPVSDLGDGGSQTAPTRKSGGLVKGKSRVTSPAEDAVELAPGPEIDEA
ncbi:hypothetical protein DFH28DRAFT_887159 [Melampsora americana]|nr:hypothetical protein DFH28DRAFT_887159 [Melampsora americana]